MVVNKTLTIITIAVIGLCSAPNRAEELFKNLVGPVKVDNVTKTDTLQVPYITWGGDMATFYANGGLKTQKGTIFDKQGLKLELKAGDDFIQQVRNYITGKTPFLRGTFRMIGMASEVLCSDPRTKGVVIMQMTWSAGDHMVARSEVKTITDLKGKTVILQKGGPHVGLLDDILKTGQLGWNDIKVIWTDDLTGTPKCPAEMFRKDKSIGACMVISPDMIGLTGGLQNIGSGAEGTVKGSRVLVSTAELSRSIADVYVCRKDFYDANKNLITKFVAGYFKACEEVHELRKQYETKGSEKYMQLLQLTQKIYGKETIPTLEEDAHGLLADCTFVGLPGNIAFFREKGRLSGFEAFQKSALDLATSRGYAKVRCGTIPSDLDYKSPAFTKYLTRIKAEKGERFKPEAVRKEIEEFTAGGKLDDRTLISFTINFAPNQETFSMDQYGVEYQRTVEMAHKYGNAVVAIRGHSDPTNTLRTLVNAGLKKGIIKRTGTKGNYKYAYKGGLLDLTATKQLAELITSGAFDGDAENDPRTIMQAALNLSLRRAEEVRDSIIKYAGNKGLTLDKSQIQPVGVGIREPFVAKPRNMQEAATNRRVEFRLIRIEAETISEAGFDF
ncbi:MAG: ABC transporter substrate-binding protein [Planctomycetota bacterium]|jgi:hypothetical protein